MFIYDMPLLLPELKGKSHAGLYAISPIDPRGKGKISYKIGRTINFKNRLNDYHICYNEGYWISAILPLNIEILMFFACVACVACLACLACACTWSYVACVACACTWSLVCKTI